MKKLISVVVVFLLVAVIATTAAFAAGPRFYDGDGDGICDYSQNCPGRNFTDQNGDGIRDYTGGDCHARYRTCQNGERICSGHGACHGWAA